MVIIQKKRIIKYLFILFISTALMIVTVRTLFYRDILIKGVMRIQKPVGMISMHTSGNLITFEVLENNSYNYIYIEYDIDNYDEQAKNINRNLDSIKRGKLPGWRYTLYEIKMKNEVGRAYNYYNSVSGNDPIFIVVDIPRIRTRIKYDGSDEQKFIRFVENITIIP